MANGPPPTVATQPHQVARLRHGTPPKEISQTNAAGSAQRLVNGTRTPTEEAMSGQETTEINETTPSDTAVSSQDTLSRDLSKQESLRRGTGRTLFCRVVPLCNVRVVVRVLANVRGKKWWEENQNCLLEYELMNTKTQSEHCLRKPMPGGWNEVQ
jgi:hypothetical protein